MLSSEIRKKFLKFFSDRDHKVVPSSSLVPANDPTLLFANAGMNQFKDVFLGREKRSYTRACSAQKCVRAGGKHNDLEQVGRTRRHHTFFEMLGNFSFGDYFKNEAIPWAWELVTKDFALPKDKLYATVFREDDEAEAIWAKIIPRDRIFRRDEKDNFWQMGETGPCGPCSEIHYDMGPEASDLAHKDCKFPCPDDCGRYVEIWNLVFMQFNRDEQGKLMPLPRPSIDTGAGLERLAAVLQGKISNFDTDLFKPLIDEAAEIAGVPYPYNEHVDTSMRVIADHARAATFLISDAVMPSNEGRGYVLRRIVRRALYHGQSRAIRKPFLYKISSTVVDIMKEAYPELVESAHRVAKVIKTEEERYARTLSVAAEQLNRAHVKISSGGRHAPGTTMTYLEYQVAYPNAESNVRGYVVGEDLFKLYDTYGAPPDFIEDIVRNSGLAVDRTGYEAEMEKQRERARASWKGAQKKIALPIYLALAEMQKTSFKGYEHTVLHGCKIVELVVNGQPVNGISPGGKVKEIEIVLEQTPFYAESGGQVGDVGRLIDLASQRELARITNTYSPVSGLIVHSALVTDELHKGQGVTGVVDPERRDAIRRNHTATHLLHAALRSELGTHVKQAGSLVAPDRLRFDFTHYASLSEQDVLNIEDLVNQHILKNEEVTTEVTELEKAIESGAMALFGEKYGEQVRVVSIDSFSKELCGGTHVARTGDIGLFKIISEGSVSAGTRRMEAVTGQGVLEHLRNASRKLALLGGILHAEQDELLESAEKLAESEKKLRKQLEAQQAKRAATEAADLVGQARETKGVRVISQRVEVTDRVAMRQMIDSLRPKLGSGVMVIGSAADGKVNLIAAVTQDLTERLDAGKIVREAAKIVEGTGGGRKDLAEAGGKNAEKLDEALRAVPGIIERML